MGQSTRLPTDFKSHPRKAHRKLLLQNKLRKDQSKSRKSNHRSQIEPTIDRTISRPEEQLQAMRSHIEFGRDLLTISDCLGKSSIGSSQEIKNLLPALNHFSYEVNDLLKCVMFDRSRLSSNELQDRAVTVLEQMSTFSGQLMVLPLSLDLFIDAKPKDCRVVIQYGGKLTSINGTHFSGRCSRILLSLHPGDTPKISLAYRKTVMGIFIKEKILGQATAQHCKLVGGGPNGGVCVELLFTEDQVGDMSISARATLQLEWFPSPENVQIV